MICNDGITLCESTWGALETVVKFMTGNINYQVPDIAYDYSPVFWLKVIGNTLKVHGVRIYDD